MVLRQPGEGLEVFFTQEIESLQVVGQDEVEPGESPSDILLFSENPIELGQVGLESFNAAVSGLVESIVLVISPIDHLDVFGVEVLVDPVGSEEGDLLISVAPEKISPLGLVAEIHADSIALGNQLIPVEEIGQRYCWVFGDEALLDLLDPLGPTLCALVPVLSVGDGEVLEELPRPLRETAYGPIAQHHSAFHKICSRL